MRREHKCRDPRLGYPDPWEAEWNGEWRECVDWYRTRGRRSHGDLVDAGGGMTEKGGLVRGSQVTTKRVTEEGPTVISGVSFFAASRALEWRFWVPNGRTAMAMISDEKG
ncbi:hypothetical protein F0562_012492 [Nyssa sinensis]|uniref:Uncharacterized protein n=1 Tax=Nyssa sinensis TaxID=561372 RepID=A0A5J4ZUV9_9ASTE|nr:hypothetical protein F0562_012492 [Nyssa sinensis]